MARLFKVRPGLFLLLSQVVAGRAGAWKLAVQKMAKSAAGAMQLARQRGPTAARRWTSAACPTDGEPASASARGSSCVRPAPPRSPSLRQRSSVTRVLHQASNRDGRKHAGRNTGVDAAIAVQRADRRPQVIATRHGAATPARRPRPSASTTSKPTRGESTCKV